MEDNKKNKVFEFVYSLPDIWWKSFRDAIIFIMFLELGLIMYKLFDIPRFIIVHLIILKVFIIGMIYLFIICTITYFLQKQIPKMRKRREKRKKEFFEELKRELRLKK